MLDLISDRPSLQSVSILSPPYFCVLCSCVIPRESDLYKYGEILARYKSLVCFTSKYFRHDLIANQTNMC